MDEFLLIITAILVAIPAALLGVILLLNKSVMIGDAISHAVLPGIVIAYLIVGTMDNTYVLIGASIAGFITTLLIDFFQTKLAIQKDAAIGTATTFLFSLGVLLLALFFGQNTELDQECVLFGAIETTVIEQVLVGETIICTRAIFQLLPLTIIVVLFVFFGFSRLKSWLFNASYTSLLGISITKWRLSVLLLLSLHAVLSFKSVGAVMLIGLLVLPGATALLLAKNLKEAFVYAVIIAILACVIGVLVGFQINVSIAPVIIFSNSLLFIGVYIFDRSRKHQLNFTKN
uniref:metal ABC transporter permease n=1 Tax=Fluviicola sp. TaxID=1917219 RepID=UPI004049F064